MLSIAEENYIKNLYRAQSETGGCVSSGEMAKRMKTRASSVTEMAQKLSKKSLVSYAKYKGVKLTQKGRTAALKTIRRHRLWEVFLLDKLGYPWEEIHPIAEQLEHVNGPGLSNRLDAFLGYPQCDPHGESIPQADGKAIDLKTRTLYSLKKGESSSVVAIKNDSKAFLAHMNALKISIGTEVKVKGIIRYDQSRVVDIAGRERQLSPAVALQILVRK